MASGPEQNILGVKTLPKRGLKNVSLRNHERKRAFEYTTIYSDIFYSDGQPYIPPTRPYELSELAVDLISLARYMLRPDGRLVFFLPTVTEDYSEVDVKSMLCEGMEVIANSLQDFGSWGRRVSDTLTSNRLISDTVAYSLSPSAKQQRNLIPGRRSPYSPRTKMPLRKIMYPLTRTSRKIL